MTMGVSELQKNISIIRKLKETLYVIVKKSNEVLETILPHKSKQKRSFTEQSVGSMANGIVVDDIDKVYHEVKEKALVENMVT